MTLTRGFDATDRAADPTRPRRNVPGPRSVAFRRFRIGFAVAQHADGLYQVALPLAALSVSNRPAFVAAVATAARLPWLVLALPAGALVDRVDRRPLLWSVNVARAVVMAALAAMLWWDRGSAEIVVLTALLLGAAETLHDTAAHTVAPQLVPTAMLHRANGQLQAAEFVANHFFGPAVGGVLAAWALHATFGAAAGLCLLAAAAAAAIPMTMRPLHGTGDAPAPRPRKAFRLLWSDARLRTYALAVGSMNIANGAYFAMLPLLVVAVSGAGAGTYGFLLAIGGAAGLGVSLASAAVLARTGDRAGLVLGCVGLAAGLAAPAVSAAPSVVGLGLGLTGLMVLVNVVTVSARQAIVPNAMLGRVTACYRLFAWGALPVGAALGGVLGELAGPRAVFLAAGALVAVSAIPLVAVTMEGTTDAQP